MRRLLSYEYLLEPIPGQPAQFRLLYSLLALGTCASLLWVTLLWRKAQPSRPKPVVLLEVVLAVLGLSLVACAFAGVPFLSMRILVFSANPLAWLVALLAWVGERERADVGRRQRMALAGKLDVVQPPLPLLTSLLLGGVHAAGLLGLALHYRCHLGYPLLVLAVVSPQLLLSARVRRWQVHLEGLAPLFLAYGVLLARLLLLVAAKLSGYPHFSLPSPWNGLLNVDFAAFVALPWAFLLQADAVLRYLQRQKWMLPGLAAALLLFSFIWGAYTYFHLCTHGVTGTDPYCYAQMAVDLVRQGLPVHQFPLAVRMQQLGVSAEAGVHLGYHLPFDAAGRAATVWPVGQSALLALGYRLAGERGLYWTTPLLGLLSLLALVLLSWELLRDRAKEERLLVSAVAAFLLATSCAQLERLVVPMADAATQLFTALTVWLWLRAMREPRHKSWALLAGLSFASAYWVRHTQLVLAVSVLFLAAVTAAPRRFKAGALAWFALSAALAAAPDLLYHRWAMGAWLRPESLELRHFSWAFVAPMAMRMVRELLTAREFLIVSPWVVVGAWWQWRRQRTGFGLLSTWVLAIVAVHLPYEALRLRDLLSVYPVLCFWAGCGVLVLWRAVQENRACSRFPLFLRGLVYGYLALALLLLRAKPTLELFCASDFNTFGRLNPSQRQAFVQIAQNTESSAWIGASLNGGALELHSSRQAFRPAVWSEQELFLFLDDALAQDRQLYLLDDGLEMAAPLVAARQRYDLRWVGWYDIPFYHPGGGSTGGRVALYRLHPGSTGG